MKIGVKILEASARVGRGLRVAFATLGVGLAAGTRTLGSVRSTLARCAPLTTMGVSGAAAMGAATTTSVLGRRRPTRNGPLAFSGPTAGVAPALVKTGLKILAGGFARRGCCVALSTNPVAGIAPELLKTGARSLTVELLVGRGFWIALRS